MIYNNQIIFKEWRDIKELVIDTTQSFTNKVNTSNFYEVIQDWDNYKYSWLNILNPDLEPIVSQPDLQKDFWNNHFFTAWGYEFSIDSNNNLVFENYYGIDLTNVLKKYTIDWRTIYLSKLWDFIRDWFSWNINNHYEWIKYYLVSNWKILNEKTLI